MFFFFFDPKWLFFVFFPVLRFRPLKNKIPRTGKPAPVPVRLPYVKEEKVKPVLVPLTKREEVPVMFRYSKW